MFLKPLSVFNFANKMSNISLNCLLLLAKLDFLAFLIKPYGRLFASLQDSKTTSAFNPIGTNSFR